MNHINTTTQVKVAANSLWNETKTALINATNQVKKDLEKQPNKSWISKEKWKQTELRRVLKINGPNSIDEKDQY